MILLFQGICNNFKAPSSSGHNRGLSRINPIMVLGGHVGSVLEFNCFPTDSYTKNFTVSNRNLDQHKSLLRDRWSAVTIGRFTPEGLSKSQAVDFSQITGG